MASRTSPRRARRLSAAIRLTALMLIALAGVSYASVLERAYVARAASLTLPTVSSAESTTASGLGTASNVSNLPIATTVTTLTTSIGSSGTSTFLTTVTTLVSSTTVTTGNVSASATSTSTAFPSLSSYSSCVDDCLQLAVSSPNCSSITDPACYCASSAFTATLVQCVTNQCGNELSTAEHVAQLFCNVASPSVSLDFPAPSASANASGSATSASSASATPTGNSASRLGLRQADSTLTPVLGSSIAGMILGALFC